MYRIDLIHSGITKTMQTEQDVLKWEWKKEGDTWFLIAKPLAQPKRKK